MDRPVPEVEPGTPELPLGFIALNRVLVRLTAWPSQVAFTLPSLGSSSPQSGLITLTGNAGWSYNRLAKANGKLFKIPCPDSSRPFGSTHGFLNNDTEELA